MKLQWKWLTGFYINHIKLTTIQWSEKASCTIVYISWTIFLKFKWQPWLNNGHIKKIFCKNCFLLSFWPEQINIFKDHSLRQRKVVLMLELAPNSICVCVCTDRKWLMFHIPYSMFPVGLTGLGCIHSLQYFAYSALSTQTLLVRNRHSVTFLLFGS